MRHLLTIAGVVVLLLVPAAPVRATKAVVPAPDMKPDQARQAVMAAAKLQLFVPVNKRSCQLIDTKSMRASFSSAEFNSAAGSKGGPHHYKIRFAAFDSASVKCNGMDCTIAGNPPGTLARDETGKAVETMLFTDVNNESGKSTCMAECHEIAMDFAAALNSLRHLALGRQGLLGPGFHEKAAAWHALATKPPVPDNVRMQRLLAEDALKNHKPGEALQYYEAGLKLYPTWPQGWFNAALISGQFGDYADAAEDMQAYLELVPDAKDAKAARDQMTIWQYKAMHSTTN